MFTPKLRPNRTASYYSRVVVPADLRGILSRREIVRSLHTTSFSEACLKAKVWEEKLAEVFTHLQRNHQRMRPEQIQRLVQFYIASTLKTCEDERLTRKVTDDDKLDAIDAGLSDALKNTTQQLRYHDFKRISATADGLLQAHQLTLSKQSPEYQRLCKELLKGQQAVLRAEIERWNGNYVDGDSSSSPAASLPAAVTPTSLKLFSHAVRDYFAHYTDRDPRTNREKASSFNRFIEIIGGDRALQDITKADCIRFRDTLSRFPRRVPDAWRGTPIADMLATLAKERPGYLTLGRGTINADLIDLRHFFSWALKHDYFAGKNPADGIDYEGVVQQSNEPYTDADLARIFNSEEYRRERTGERPERYWLPLVLLFTGARREEIAALALADVKKSDDGIDYFDITPTEGRRLKTKASKRRVPLHSHLIDLGFLSYVNQMRREGQAKNLFPKKLDKRRGKGEGRTTPGDAVNKFWKTLLKGLGIEGKKTCHSFRHTVVTRLMAADVPQDMREVLVGHESQTVHGKTYGHREFIPLAVLKGHLEKLDFRKCLAELPRYR